MARAIACKKPGVTPPTGSAVSSSDDGTASGTAAFPGRVNMIIPENLAPAAGDFTA
jgi:hypothetical protein